MPSTPEPVLGALQLRGWALRTLCSAAPAAAPPPASAQAWRLFLAVEQCALALSARAGRVLPPAAAAAVERRVLDETRRVLSARARLRRLDGAARDGGLRLVVLKGGVPLLRGGDGPRLQDVDVLGSPADAAALAAMLDEGGYAAHGRAASHRLAVRAAEGDIPVEIHTAVPGLSAAVWERVRPVSKASALLVLHPRDHLRYLLLHSAVQHADRRGRLRDLLVVAEAVRHASVEDLRAVEGDLAAEPQAAVLARQLEMGRGVAEGVPCADAFELTAAGTYLLQTLVEDGAIPAHRRDLAWQSVTAAVARRSGTPADLGEHALALPSAVPALAALRRVSPRAERLLRTLVRRSREWAFLPLGLRIAAAAERAVRERAASG